MNKYEQLIEFIINDESDKARNLFHTIVVEKSRDIYESLTDDEDVVGGNQMKGLVDEVSVDEQGLSEEEDAGFEDEINSGDFGGDDTASEFDTDDIPGDEFGDDTSDIDGGDETPATKGDLVSLESALDELSAKFDELMGQADDVEGDDFGGDDLETTDDTSSDFDTEFDDEDDTVDTGEEEIVREYVEKVAASNRTGEGQEVGKGGKTTSVNTKSISAGKNDFGGTANNIVQGKAGSSAPNAPQKASNYGTKGQGTVPVASRNINVPGGKAGGAFKTKQSAASGEGQTTDGKQSVSTGSLLKARK